MVILWQVKAYLWITGDDDDVRLQSILDGVNETVKTVCGDLSYGTKKMEVENSNIKLWKFTLLIVKPESVDKINGVDFTDKTNGVDYKIQSDWHVVIKNLYDYAKNDFDNFEVEYTAWFTETPKNLIALVSNYVWFLFSQDMGKNVIEEKLWPRGVKFSENDDLKAKKDFILWLQVFVPLSLKVW